MLRAIQYATTKHDGQYRKGSGDPYITHPLRVMEALADQPLHVRIAGVLHDTVEDTDATLEEIEEQFGPKVRHLVDALSRRDGENYADFIDRVHAAGEEAVCIKRADILDNLRDLEGSLRGRYERALDVLGRSLSKGG